MPPEIRTITDDEIRGFLDAISTAFLERPDLERLAAEVGPVWDLSRAWAAVDGRVVGTLRSWATEVTVPGGAQVPASAIAAVAVLPTHRRRGILRALVTAEHRAARDRGEPVALLYASEYPIYGRFGYGPGCRTATWAIDALATGFEGGPATGVELVTPDAAARDLVRSVFERHRVRRVGEIRRRDIRWDADLGLMDVAWGKRWNGFLALRRDAAGDVDGYVRYAGEEKWERRQPRAAVTVQELHALTDEAYAALWRHCVELDLVALVRAEMRSPRERLPWLLTNARAAAMSDVGDGLWVRLLDPVRALGARTYERSAALVLEIVDSEVPSERQRLRLEAGPEGATCVATRRSPDLTLDVAALGAAFLGGTRLLDATRARGADEHRAGALAEADRLFSTLDEPWCSTFF